MKFSEETVDYSDCCGAIDVVITIDQDLFLVADSLDDSRYGFFHILHQKRIVQIRQLWPKKLFRFVKTSNSPVDEQFR
ncbi:hypothetical protein D3C85_1743190 [compost metagenome]